MKNLLSRLALLTVLPLATPAQTANWIAPGSIVTSANADWNDAANWDTGVVPNSSSAVAVVNQTTNAGIMTPIPGGAQPVITGNITLGEMHFDLPANDTTRFTGIYVSGTDSLAGLQGTLRLEGPGLTVSAAGTDAYNYVDVRVQPGGTLEFVNQAVISRTGFNELRLRLFGHYENPARLIFRDDAAVAPGAFALNGLSLLGHAAIEFHDRSRAGDWPLQLVYNTSLGFFEQASAQNAILTSPKDGYGASVVFNDQSTAAQAILDLQNVTFNGQSTAGSATITNAGFQNYSGHGQYSSYFTTVLFHDATSAGQATISNNPFGILAFHDNSSAANATISNQGTVSFSGASSFDSAHLIAGSGSYMEGAGYNQSREVTTGQVIFQDQATGGNGRIEIASANAILDFSGLNSGVGTTGRAPLVVTPATPAVVADDRVSFSLGSITNTSPGGTIYLGSTLLVVGSDNRDMTLSARISDIGGKSGSAAGEPLGGGEIAKVGTGTLTLTNPDNNYGGTTGVYDGTLNLAGGTVANVVLSNFGRLTGTGHVRGMLGNGAAGTGAVVSPGNSTGTITVTGDYIQYAGGTLSMEIASDSNHDQLVVDGRAFLNGRLNVSFLNGYVPVNSSTIPLLTADELNGQFTTVSLPGGLGAALSAEVVLTLPGISLQITQLPFGGFAGGSPAAGALAAHLDATLAMSTGDYRDLIVGLNTLDAPGLATALDALAPDRYTVLATQGHLAAVAWQGALDRRLAALRTGPARGFELFFEASHRTADFDAVAGLPDAESTVSRGTAGGAWRNGAFSLGASLTEETGDMILDALGSHADLESLTPAIFFQYAADRFFVNAAAAFSHDDYDLRRRIIYPGYDQTATAVPSGKRTDLALTSGYVFRTGSWTLTPELGLLRSAWTMDGFLEAGATGANLSLSDWSAISLRTRVGFEARRPGPAFSPRLALFWLRETKDDRSLSAAFAGAMGAPYAVPGRPADQNLMQAALGFDWRLGKRAVFNATLAGAWGDNSRLTSDLSAGLHWTF